MFMKVAILFILCVLRYTLSQTEKSILLRLDPKEIVDTFKNVISSTYIREMADQMANKAAQQFIQKMKFKKMRLKNKKVETLGRQGEDLREVSVKTEKRHFENDIKYDAIAKISTKEIRHKPRGRLFQNEAKHYQQQQVPLYLPQDMKAPPPTAVTPQQYEGKYSDEARPSKQNMLRFEDRIRKPVIGKINDEFKEPEVISLSKPHQSIDNQRPEKAISQVSAEKEIRQTKISSLHDNGNDVPVVKEEFQPLHKKVEKEDTKPFAPYRESHKVDVTLAPDQLLSLPKPPFQKKRLRHKNPKTDRTLLDENVAFALLKEPSPDGDDWELDSLEMSEIRNDIPVVEVKKINGVYFRRLLGSVPLE